MFLDDELKQIYDSHEGNVSECYNKLINACLNRIEKDTGSSFINSLKRIESSFRLFAKKTENINPNAFKVIIHNKLVGDDEGKKVLNILNW